MSQTFSIENTINCPQCGYALPLYMKHTKLVQCDACKSTIFLDNDAAKLAGESSVLAPEVSIIELNKPFFHDHKTYLPLGMIRYSYGRGFWEEWWVKDKQNNAFWLSVDEGDLVLQEKVENTYDNDIFNTLHIGQTLSENWVVTELGTATCEGFSGSLPKTVVKGSTYKYAHLSGEKAALRTLETGEDGIETYEGKWISPFDIGKVH